MRSPFTTRLKFSGGVIEINVTEDGIGLNVGEMCMNEISGCSITITRSELADLKSFLAYVWDHSSAICKKGNTTND